MDTLFMGADCSSELHLVEQYVNAFLFLSKLPEVKNVPQCNCQTYKDTYLLGRYLSNLVPKEQIFPIL